MRNLLSALTLVSVLGLSAQTITGKVYDEVNQVELPGATVQIIGTERGTTTDERGIYTLENLEPGRYNLRVGYVGYASKVITDVWVKSGRVIVQDFPMERDYTGLEAIEVSEKVILSEPGRLYITEEQINRFAATYFDPARLATSSPDVIVSNDQNNRVSARGISPAYNTWRLEGAEIVNPNHLSNAGTFSDQPTATGGGVNMLSAQMLDRSAFLYSTFDNTYTNSVGGVFDMHLKNGNKLNRQYTAQASLIGFDLATEGPFKEGGGVTYSANYRYSFTGLLTSFGVDFGGESIGFQDLALNVAIPIGDRSELKIFGVGGLSFNNFEHRTFQESEVEKDRKDIYYDNKTGIIGLRLSNSFEQGKLTTSLVFSGYENEWKENRYDINDQQIFTRTIASAEMLSSLHTQYSRRINRQELKIGGIVNYYDRNFSQQYADSFLAQPYVQLSGPVGSRLSTTVGVTYNQTEEDLSFDPRASITYAVGQKQFLSLGTGLYSQLLNPYNASFNNPYGYFFYQSPTDPYGLITSFRNTLSYLYENAGFNIGGELFLYHFPEVTVYFEEEKANTYGITVSSEKSFENDFYYRLGGSLFSSDISGPIENQYDNRYNFSLASGKEWDFSGKGKNRSLSVNGRILYQGGQHYGRLTVENAEVGDLFLADIAPYQTKPYFRFDLRVQWTRHRENRTSSIALDLQNALGTENEAYKYYDRFTDQVETQYQLGLIPILTYRVEW